MAGSLTIKIEVVEYCVEAVDIRSHEFLSVARFLGTDYMEIYYSNSDCESPLEVHAACNGLLLLSYNNCLHLCNPTTRQWVWVSPPALPCDKVAGLYHAHDEYRVLYYRAIGLECTFYVSTVGSGKERCIPPYSSSTSLRAWFAERLKFPIFREPFLFHGNLHWLAEKDNILMFNTVDEVFQWLPLPFKGFASSLLETEGKLAVSKRTKSSVDLWLLQDYERVVWVHKYQIELPVIDIRRFEEMDLWDPHIVSEEGDVWIDAGCWQLHYDRKGNLLEKFQCDGRVVEFTAHILRESLVPDAVFQNSDNDSRHAPHFFRWL